MYLRLTEFQQGQPDHSIEGEVPSINTAVKSDINKQNNYLDPFLKLHTKKSLKMDF